MILKGSTFIMRDIRESDMHDRRRAGVSSEISRMYGSHANHEELEAKDAKQWYETLYNAPCAWVIEKDGKCIGQSKLTVVSAIDQNAWFTIGFFSTDHLNQGLGTEATQLVLDFGFNTLDLHKISLEVLDLNLRGIQCFKKCGFQIDGTLRENLYFDGQWIDDLIMSILRSEYEVVNPS